MKIYKYIVINKNNMAYLEHYNKFSDLADYLSSKGGEFIILVDEKDVFQVSKSKHELFREKSLTKIPVSV